MSKLKDFTNKKYPTDADLDAFCQEHFRTVRKQFGDGLSRQRKVVELFDRATEADVIAGLRKDGHGEELQSFLEARIQTVPGYTGPAVEPPAQPTSAQPGLPALAPIVPTVHLGPMPRPRRRIGCGLWVALGVAVAAVGAIAILKNPIPTAGPRVQHSTAEGSRRGGRTEGRRESRDGSREHEEGRPVHDRIPGRGGRVVQPSPRARRGLSDDPAVGDVLGAEQQAGGGPGNARLRWAEVPGRESDAVRTSVIYAHHVALGGRPVTDRCSYVVKANVTVHARRRDQVASSEGALAPSMWARQAATMKSCTEAPRCRRVA